MVDTSIETLKKDFLMSEFDPLGPITFAESRRGLWLSDLIPSQISGARN